MAVFNSDENSHFKIGKEVPKNDVNLMYFEVPDITVDNSLEVVSLLLDASIGEVKIRDIIDVIHENTLFTDTEYKLRDTASTELFQTNTRYFCLTDIKLGGQPLYYRYKTLYRHIGTPESINIYKDNELLPEEDFVLKEDGGYITILHNFDDDSFYQIEYNPDDLLENNYRETVNFKSVFSETTTTRVRRNRENPEYKRFCLHKKNGGYEIEVPIKAEETKRSWHNIEAVMVGGDVEFEYEIKIRSWSLFAIRSNDPFRPWMLRNRQIEEGTYVATSQPTVMVNKPLPFIGRAATNADNPSMASPPWLVNFPLGTVILDPDNCVEDFWSSYEVREDDVPAIEIEVPENINIQLEIDGETFEPPVNIEDKLQIR